MALAAWVYGWHASIPYVTHAQDDRDHELHDAVHVQQYAHVHGCLHVHTLEAHGYGQVGGGCCCC